MRSFRDFMESALYDPERGYYSVREKTADFYTAPELHCAFGAVLADRLALLLERIPAGPGDVLSIVEAGCGDGTLACQAARRLREKHPGLAARVAFVLVERGRKDLTTAARRLNAFGVKVTAYTEIEKVPPFRGVLYSNELLDALPVHLLEARDGRVQEVFVDDAGKEVCGPLSRPELEAHAGAMTGSLQEGARHAVSLEAAAWLAGAAARVREGFIVSIDYGKRFAPGTANPPRAFHRHAVETELTREPGARDLTASVDFEALIKAGEPEGLSLEAFETLSKFLIEGGLLGFLEAAAGDDSASYRERAKLKTLIHPEGMGEVFKVLIMRKAK